MNSVMQDAHGSNQDDAPASPSSATAERPELRYRFECETIDEFGALYAPDISRGGIFIRTQQVLPLASAVKIELLLADETPFISAEGLVFWTRAASEPGTTQGEPGMGIRFTRMSQDSHRNLTRILAVKQAEDWIRAAEAAAELNAESHSFDHDHDDEEIGDVETAVVKIADLRAVVGTAAARRPEAAAPAQPLEAAGAVTAVVPLETLAADTAPTAALAPPSGPAPVSVPRSLSHPIPALPDWAFVSTRFGAGRTPASSPEGVSQGVSQGASEGGSTVSTDPAAEADRAAVPTHIPDLRDASFGAPGSMATQTVSPQTKEIAPAPASGLGWLRRHTGLRLVLGAALVLVTALAVAPRHKPSKATGQGRTRIGAAVSPEARPASGAGAPTAATAPAPSPASTPAYPVMFGPEPPPSSERVVSSR